MNSPLNLRVHAMRYEAQGIVSVELRDVDGKTLPEYAPGAHIELHLGNGLVRSYSLCGAPEMRDRYVVGVLLDRNSRGGSRYVHEQLRVGSMLKIGGPRNHFELDETAPRTVLVAGGIGVTPILGVGAGSHHGEYQSAEPWLGHGDLQNSKTAGTLAPVLVAFQQIHAEYTLRTHSAGACATRPVAPC